jgi:hypothetical protein
MFSLLKKILFSTKTVREHGQAQAREYEDIPEPIDWVAVDSIVENNYKDWKNTRLPRTGTRKTTHEYTMPKAEYDLLVRRPK